MWSLFSPIEDSDICLTLLYFKMVDSLSDAYCQICVGKAYWWWIGDTELVGQNAESLWKWVYDI